MELRELKGNIIGLIGDYPKIQYDDNLKVSEIVTKKNNDSLKMVGLNIKINDMLYKDLSIKEKNKVNLASQLTNDIIILHNFSQGLLQKEFISYRNLLKKISLYNRKIILIENNAEFFLNLVDKVYVINKDEIVFQTSDLFYFGLYQYIDMPKIVEFTYLTKRKGIKIDNYSEFNDLLKAIYRLKE